ncbi:MAG: class I SAM-dependent RNA methyltransferase [Rhodospirillaceae bacterium]|jgi:23S rRNA (uracil1939-C5)-methyltransferase|nr:class I SAM-dependent RNA methyltransferase [Rhodospirillaceae bacterium]MBT5193267.1 class I SAM-dependent RNA methyltransferase [Rhodospirillaceae bacterium]MBT5898089.1 class I SAM-dependent RNA methyltransferase [Rhodospirillaceae bacterium]MBT6428876.1 class I SAM-dependent RNA methyltransferase [Rhodospirillaceae bacterium]MBT7756474.1 class I SAM-dependent RNA methyltransferase [Rhodospirillaceae bacterium]
MTELTIDTLGGRGDGVAHDDAGPIYVPLTVPADRVEATITGRRGDARVARLDKVLRPGPARVEPPCPHFGQCGGCAMQHLATETYGEWKLDILRQALARRGLDNVPIRDMIAVPPASRRRARFSARHTRHGLHLGFNAPGSHDIVNLQTCHILVPAIVAVLDDVRALLSELLPGGGKADVQITETETGLDLWLVVNLRRNAQTDMRLAEFAQSLDLARLSMGLRPDVVMVRRAPRVTFNGVAVTPPPDGFLQASLAGERALVDLVRQGVGGAAKVADLFAGVGTFSFALDADVEVLAVEGAEDQAQALTEGRNGARRTRIEVQVRDLERRHLSVDELRSFEAVVFDPPRIGARNQTPVLAASGVAKVVAVSCNPSTFARDARALVDGGYHLTAVTPVDQFPWSRHLELVAHFQRG